MRRQATFTIFARRRNRCIDRRCCARRCCVDRRRATPCAGRSFLAPQLSEREQAVEQMVVRVLRANHALIPGDTRAGLSPEESLAWAREVAHSIASWKGEYHPLPPVAVWARLWIRTQREPVRGLSTERWCRRVPGMPPVRALRRAPVLATRCRS
jgi:hypothetical protein